MRFVSCHQFILSGALHYLDDAYPTLKIIILSRLAQNSIRISCAHQAISFINQKEFWGEEDMQEWLDAQKFDAICQQLVFLNLPVAARSLKDISHIL